MDPEKLRMLEAQITLPLDLPEVRVFEVQITGAGYRNSRKHLEGYALSALWA
jgi:hypothetical protein